MCNDVSHNQNLQIYKYKCAIYETIESRKTQAFVVGFIAALTLSTSVASTRDVSRFAFDAILRKNRFVPGKCSKVLICMNK